MSGDRPRYWLMKSEPDAFSFDDLVRSPKRTNHWDGVRNYQARNFMRDEFAVGDQVFFYHSRIKEPAVVGIAEVVRGGYPDPTALDPDSPYYDPKSAEKGESRWVMVDVRASHRMAEPVTLKQIRQTPELEGMWLIKRGMRLSIQPVAHSQWETIVKMGRPEPI